MGVSTAYSEQKKKEILTVATDLFIERGYDGVSIDAIVKEVGGSKSNIYNYFGGKEGLFRAIVEDVSEQILSPLKQAEVENLPLKEGLTAIGKQAMSIILSDRAIGLLRIVIAQSRKFPEVAQLFFQVGPKTRCKLLVEYIEQQQAQGKIKPCDSYQAATQFIGMFLGFHQLQRVLGITSNPTEEEINAIVEDAVKTFMVRYSQ
ncbi:TetR/AcrR family transcriptional regulator [Euhalothece natronophila Z-M001]|uniref:TetR/AcrR family transcriptional regulator n=1 Tax=Euhalothece natronophila Z-M001 TaxID=522448 RepID=A0A5B8NP50_9CHRO|nr:TetR/AcrR family transcriptional regulator [Euhalothece natronophila]QDZ40848.1 TetR/AcrR family transcriptional regulator [Euhalothece natronophila Z-M001]